MKINYFFPVYEEDNIKSYLKYFENTNFFKKYSKYKFVFVCLEKDKKNVDFLLKEADKKKYKIITLNKKFTYNDAFYNALEFFDGDIVLIGDCKVQRIDLVFNKCLEKYDKNASVVHIVKRHSKFKEFLFRNFSRIYNFFIKLFTDKTDRLNVISLGLIDKNIIDLLKTVKPRCCFLKNTKKLLGFETRTIYISSETITYKLNYFAKTFERNIVILNLCLILVIVFSLILLNCFLKIKLLVYNIIGILLIILNICSAIILFFKHIFNIRNCENNQSNFVLKEEN